MPFGWGIPLKIDLVEDDSIFLGGVIVGVVLGILISFLILTFL